MYKKWMTFGTILKEVLTAVTFLSMFPVMVFILYHMFWDIDVWCVLIGDVTLLVLYYVNSHL